jgi:hypothetical protein
MPRPPLPIDWQAVRALYLGGANPNAIAKRFAISINTLRSRACREKWNVIRDGGKESKARQIEKTAEIARDIWAERREAIRENIHTIGSKMTSYAAQLPEDQLLAKADKIKIAAEIAGKIVGLDRMEDRNVINIALLGAIDSPTETYDDFRVHDELPQCGTISLNNRVGHRDCEAVDTTTHPTTVDPTDPISP